MNQVCPGSQQFIRGLPPDSIPAGLWACPVCKRKVDVDGYGRTVGHAAPTVRKQAIH